MSNKSPVVARSINTYSVPAIKDNFRNKKAIIIVCTWQMTHKWRLKQKERHFLPRAVLNASFIEMNGSWVRCFRSQHPGLEISIWHTHTHTLGRRADVAWLEAERKIRDREKKTKCINLLPLRWARLYRTELRWWRPALGISRSNKGLRLFTIDSPKLLPQVFPRALNLFAFALADTT